MESIAAKYIKPVMTVSYGTFRWLAAKLSKLRPGSERYSVFEAEHGQCWQACLPLGWERKGCAAFPSRRRMADGGKQLPYMYT